MMDKVDIIMRDNSRCFGCKEKIHEKQMLEKYPNLYKGESCYICKADLRCLHKIHRINFEWYCDKCYKKKRYIFPNIIEISDNDKMSKCKIHISEYKRGQKMRKAICNYCGKKDYLHNYLQFTMCDKCIEKIKKQIS